VNQHTAIPRTYADTTDPNFLQAIANTVGFHFPTIEQGGTSLYPSLAQRATHTEVLRILISIGPTETMHFQTWSDKAGNAPPLTAVDPVTGVSVTFPDLNSPPFGGELFQTNLIMPEPCPFLDASLPIVSIIRPTNTAGAAMGALNFLTNMGLFIGQSSAFFAYMTHLAQAADQRQARSWLSGKIGRNIPNGCSKSVTVRVSGRDERLMRQGEVDELQVLNELTLKIAIISVVI
jgi:hypothetical protein